MRKGMSRMSVIELPLYTPRRPNSRSTTAHAFSSILTSSNILSLCQGKCVLDLETDLGDLHRVGRNHLNAASTRTCKHSAERSHIATLVCQEIAEHIVPCQS